MSEHASDARVVELMRLGRPPAPEDEQHTLEAVLSGLEGRRAQATSLSRYVLRERIGIGGAGLVYVAWDPKLCRKVAIKLLRVLEGDDRVEEHRTRLLREAQALAQLTHPNIVSVYDVGTYDLKDVDSAVAGIDVPPSGVFVVMELIEGQSLSDWIRVPDRSWQEIRDVFVAAGRGLAAAHSHGLVHRDFKPHNVVVGHDGEARVVDFGLARAASASEMQPSMTQQDIGTLGGDVTLAGTVLGTPNYMAPEQHRAQQTDARTDQYGFCVALYECLYRELPFRGSTVDELYRAKLRGQLPPPAVDVPVPSWMHAVLKRGLSPEPNDRHETMDALLLELRREGRARPLRRVALAGAGIAAAAVLVILAALPVDGGVQPPKDPEIRARVDELRQQLEESKMLGESGKTREGLDKTRVILTEAKQLGYGPLEAESWLQLGRLHGEAFDPAAEEAAMQALATADANKMDEVRAQATILLVNVLGYIQFRSQEAQQWGKLAQAAIDRMGGDPQLQADLFGSLGHVFRMRGEYLYALELGLRQVAVLEQLGQTGNRLVCALTLVGMTSRKLGDYDQARAYLERAVNTVTQPHEADHPHFADVLMELGRTYLLQGEYAKAHAELGRAQAITETSIGKDAPFFAQIVLHRGRVFLRERQYELAREHIEQAMAINVEAFDADHAQLAYTRTIMGELHRRQGNYDKARAGLEKAVDSLEKSQSRWLWAQALTELGTTHLKAGDAPAALRPLEQAVATLESRGKNTRPKELAEARFALGRALWASGQELSRAHALVSQARETFAAIGKDQRQDMEEAEIWLQQHPTQ